MDALLVSFLRLHRKPLMNTQKVNANITESHSFKEMKILRHHWNKLDREDRWMVKMIAFCITCLVLIHFFAPMKIKTQNIHPPIPSRLFDWLATVEHLNEDSPQGWGATEAEAIADLNEQLMADCDREDFTEDLAWLKTM